MKKSNNKGFSLVELIIVIAIMVILVAVLAPQFTKYVERSRLSTDVQTASEVATTAQVAFADGKITAGTKYAATTTNFDTLSTDATAVSTYFGKGTTFDVTVDANGAVTVVAGTIQAYPTDASLSSELAK